MYCNAAGKYAENCSDNYMVIACTYVLLNV